MSREERHRPEETDFAEARGAGLAAILMFLQIALIGYLLYALYYLATGENAITSLTPLRAGWQYFLPAAFAAFSLYPTDPLTRVVGKCAATTGVVTWVLFVVGAGIGLNTVSELQRSASLLYIQCLAGILLGSGLGVGTGMFFTKGLHRLRPVWGQVGQDD